MAQLANGADLCLEYLSMIDENFQPMDNGPARKRRQRLNTFTYPRPRCPFCGCAILRKYRSITNQGDGSALSWVRCGNKSCGHRFRILLE